jgi:hypothetical protein
MESARLNVLATPFLRRQPLFRYTLLGKCPEELDGGQVQIIVIIVILVCLSQSDETAFRRLRNRKRPQLREILVVRVPINLRPTLAIQRTLTNPRFQTESPECVVSRADAHFAEIPANPLAWLVL